jgi:SAM-dependent methyltransferase
MDDRTPGTRYVFEPSDAEHRRLVRMARLGEAQVREGCARAGVGAGAAVVEFGCGPLGALGTLADLVGPGGVVVGVDRSAEALAAARGVLDARGCDHVALRQLDLNTFGVGELCPPGPFDLAYTHFVLMYQTDPAASLRRMASVVRPGGHVVVQELVDLPILVPSPFSDAADRFVNRWFFPLLRRVGGSPDVARRLSVLGRAAGLEEVSCRPFAVTVPPERGAEGAGVYHDSLLGARNALLAHAVATEDEIEDALAALRLAERSAYAATAFGHLQMELVARVP